MGFRCWTTCWWFRTVPKSREPKGEQQSTACWRLGYRKAKPMQVPQPQMEARIEAVMCSEPDELGCPEKGCQKGQSQLSLWPATQMGACRAPPKAWQRAAMGRAVSSRGVVKTVRQKTGTATPRLERERALHRGSTGPPLKATPEQGYSSPRGRFL